eukprot:scaffold1727_cov133-Cylindrotheca_fusiformis.AAC.18
MVAKDAKKLPKGTAQVPQWWMEACPHYIYESEEEAARVKAEYEEAMMFQNLPDEIKQQYGGDEFPNWDPAENGPMGEEMTKAWETRGYYKRDSDNKWVDKEGAPLEGRQFTITPPAGYTPGGGSTDGGDDTIRSPLKSGGYANSEDKGWAKPSWATKKLRSTTPKGGAGAGKQMTELERIFAKKN